MRSGHRPTEEFQDSDPRAPFCRASVVARLVRRLELPPGSEVLEWGVARGTTAATLARLGMSVTLVEPDEAALDRVLQGVRAQVKAVMADRPPATMAGRFALVLLHARDALGDEVAGTAREFLAPEGRVAFVRPVRVLLRPPPGLVERWERHWGSTLRTPQELLGSLPAAGYEPDFAETLGLDEMDSLYGAAPDALAEEAALYRAGAVAISFAMVTGRRREPDEKPRPSRDRG
ncbi:MAG TPA: hypothetical protein VMT45_03160 [Thermoanaerobaculaceae bacterium]|nr:hypothetical protein [Thermoanaerobaculaceae bacterium]